MYSRGVSESFPIFSDIFCTASDDNVSQEINLIAHHFQSSKKSFRNYLPLPDANNRYIRDPFDVDIKRVKNLTANEENSFAELPFYTSLRSSFIQYSISDSWLHVK
jgi:hypothetical protein